MKECGHQKVSFRQRFSSMQMRCDNLPVTYMYSSVDERQRQQHTNVKRVFLHFVHSCKSIWKNCFMVGLHSFMMNIISEYSSYFYEEKTFSTWSSLCAFGHFCVDLIKWMKKSVLRQKVQISIVTLQSASVQRISLSQWNCNHPLDARIWTFVVFSCCSAVFLQFLIVYFFRNQLKQCTHVIKEEIPKFADDNCK